MKRVVILGSTGSIGTQTLDVVAAHRDRFAVVGLAAHTRAAELAAQAKAFSAGFVALTNEAGVPALRQAIDSKVKIFTGDHALTALALESDADIIVAGTDGAAAFDAIFAAVERGIDIAVANKELIVAAGELLFASAKRSGSQILPIDSEHSAIFQCLVGEAPERVAALILTASGGPFLRMTQRDVNRATVAQALAHPTWQMGAKNSVDSATMMNKGLEVIEASRFFNQPGSNVHVLVHPQSIIHGMVLFSDGNVKVQLSPPDMRLPIGYALAYPERLPQTGAQLDPLVAAGGNLGVAPLRYEFERPDLGRFPCLGLAYDALALGGTAPAMLSAANEIAVEAFIKGEIGFTSISVVVERVMKSSVATELTLSRVREADARARQEALAAVNALRQEIEV